MRATVTADVEELREELRRLALGLGFECTGDDCVPFDRALARLAHAPAGLVLVDVGPDRAAALPPVERIAAKVEAPVLVLGPSASSEEILQFLRAGAREYLERGRARDELPAVLDKLHQAGAVKYRQGKTAAVTAAYSGCGVTTIAAGLAFALARQHPDQVVLAEVGATVPELALDLDLTPSHSVADLFVDWDRMDAGMIRQTVVAHEEGVQVLAQPPETLDPLVVQPPVMRQLVLLLRTLFDHTVLDLGPAFTTASSEALRLADRVVVVTRLDVPGLRRTRRFLRELLDKGVSEEKVVLVANRYGQGKQIGWRKAEQALGAEVNLWVPDAPGVLNRALNEGQPFVVQSGWSRITRRMKDLARLVSGGREEATLTGRLSNMAAM